MNFIPMKQWRMQESERLHLAPSTIDGYLRSGRFSFSRVKKKNKRVIFVPDNERIVIKIKPPMPEFPTVGEKMSLKSFVLIEAARRGIKMNAIYSRVWRGCYPKMKLEKKNSRVIFVLNPEEL